MSECIRATVIEDSVTEWGARLTTLELVFHRFILPEVNTYRMWSRSAASSRAIPANTRIDQVRLDPAMPVRFGKNQKGMVADEELDGTELSAARSVWMEAAQAAADYAEYLKNLGVAKEITNRVVEPFTWHYHVVSATDFTNCFNQRIPKEAGAQSEFAVLASCIKEALEQSDPVVRKFGEWHLPFITDEERDNHSLQELKLVSAARVARTSYLKRDKTFEADLDLAARLLSSKPIHYAPFEMVATPALDAESQTLGNFDGWKQMRHML